MERRRHPSNRATTDAESDLSRQVDRLQRDLARRDRELEDERAESERGLQRIAKLEKDRVELKRELEDVRDEASEYQRLLEELQTQVADQGTQRGTKRRPGDGVGEEDREDLEDQLRDLQYELNDKNREIGQLVEDLEKLEDEKGLLKDKLSDLSETLQDATAQLETMSRDRFELKSKLEKMDEKVKGLEEEKTVLQIKERELLAFKERHDKYLENLCSAVDIRVDVWKKMMFQKDEEIDRLNTKIGALMTQIPPPQLDTAKTNIQQLKRKLLDREEQLSLLTDKLYQATEELNRNSKAVESLQSRLQRTENTEETERLLHSFEKKVRKRDLQLEKLGETLRATEHEAEEKSREIVELLSRLHLYEVGEYGLPEAVAEIKDLKHQVRVRNNQVESVTQEINRVSLDLAEVIEENEMLRGQAGLSYQEDLAKERKTFVKNKRNEIEALRTRVDLLGNEIVQLKSKNYGLRKQVLAAQGGHGQQPLTPPPHHHQHQQRPEHRDRDPGLNTSEEWRGKYEIILDENTELRKGFQEILESMHRLSEEGTSNVMIESPILENLLREMSARGLINYPYAISSFHLKVCNLEGKNSQLREELHRIRQEEKLLRSELIEAKAQAQFLEERLRSMSIATSTAPRSPRSKSLERSPRKVDFAEPPAPEPAEQLAAASTLPQRHGLILEELKQEVDQLRDENNNLKSGQNQERAALEARLRLLVDKGNALFSENLGDSDKVSRKFSYLKALRDTQAAEVESLHRRVAEVENQGLSRIAGLERFKAKALVQITTFLHLLESSVPLALFTSAKKEVLDLGAKCQTLRHASDKMSVQLLRKGKEELDFVELKDLNGRLQLELTKLRPQSSYSLDTGSSVSVNLQEDNQELLAKLIRLSELMKASEEEVRSLKSSKAELESRVDELSQAMSGQERSVKEVKLALAEAVPRDEYDRLKERLIEAEEAQVFVQDEILKWKEMADLSQNQINALQNMKHFERMELESLVSQVCDLQAGDVSKGEMARVKQELVATEKEKHLALQQVQKMGTRLAHVEAAQLQQDKVYLDREMGLIAMHSQVISRYRSLFSALHDLSASPGGRVSPSSKDVSEAWNLFKSCKERAERLERELDAERGRVEEYREKALSLEEMLTALREGRETQLSFEYAQRAQDSRVEVSRWKRRAEQCEREISALQEHLHRAETYASELEEDRIRLEHSMELKESLVTNFMSSGKVPVHKTVSTTALPPVGAETADRASQTEDSLLEAPTDRLAENCAELLRDVTELKTKILELEALLKAKDQVINNFRVLTVESRPGSARDGRSEAMSYELQESLQVARETMASLNERLKAKDEALNQYKRLLADVRAEMSSGTERHVQEMKALQLTIYQQQQSFTRMKSTLSHPVKDNSSIDGTIKDQLTRINELEDELSELQHTLGNVASQLTSARSEAHRWRSTADGRLKELDALHDQLHNSETLEELNTLRQKVRNQQDKISELHAKSLDVATAAGAPADTNPVTVLMHLLEEKDKQLEAYAKAAITNQSSHKLNERVQMEERIQVREKEIEGLRSTNKELQSKLSSLQVKVSKINATNQKSGISAEMEELRTRFRIAEEQKNLLQLKLDEFEIRVQAEDEKKRKTVDGYARWEEGKKWKKTVEKLESKIKELEEEAAKGNKTVESLRMIISRLERDKLLLESRLKGPKGSKSKETAPDGGSSSLAETETIVRLKVQIADLNELVERTEFEGREEVERLKMETRILKDRIVAQERQLTAYQVAGKGDPKMVQEIEKMAASEDVAQKQIMTLEEENLHLKLQIEQLRLDTPRLRDRVQHLQKLVEVLKSEKPEGKAMSASATRSSSQRSLSELERTISALKSVIEKLQSENKRLKKPTAPGYPTKPSTSTEKLKATLESLMDEKKALLDQVHHLERERSKFSKLYTEANSRLAGCQAQLSEAEQRTKSAEMRLKTFLDKDSEPTQLDSRERAEANALVVQQLKTLREELERKDRLLNEAKVALQEAAADKKITSKK